ncbi:MAG: four helix bundle protein [Acidobacteria bacterium]|nr:four helix bundle protein [Acidobacteriota bacterium]
MRPHEKLDVWKLSVEMVVNVYEITKIYPSEERFGLTSQTRRAAVSIPANIAEGAARQHDKEFLQFPSVAQGSASELETELLIAHRLGYLEESAHRKIYDEVNTIAPLIIGLTNHVKSRMR